MIIHPAVKKNNEPVCRNSQFVEILKGYVPTKSLSVIDEYDKINAKFYEILAEKNERLFYEMAMGIAYNERLKSFILFFFLANHSINIEHLQQLENATKEVSSTEHQLYTWNLPQAPIMLKNFQISKNKKFLSFHFESTDISMSPRTYINGQENFKVFWSIFLDAIYFNINRAGVFSNKPKRVKADLTSIKKIFYTILQDSFPPPPRRPSLMLGNPGPSQSLISFAYLKLIKQCLGYYYLDESFNAARNPMTSKSITLNPSIYLEGDEL